MKGDAPLTTSSEVEQKGLGWMLGFPATWCSRALASRGESDRLTSTE
jgi:hypothetical protein